MTHNEFLQWLDNEKTRHEQYKEQTDPNDTLESCMNYGEYSGWIECLAKVREKFLTLTPIDIKK